MSLIKPGFDTKHIIQKARNSKGLVTVAEEVELYEARKGEPIDVKKILADCKHARRALYNKSDLESFRYSCEGKTPDEIFEKLGIRVQYNLRDGSKTISHYRWPFNSYCFKAAGIDEHALLEGVTRIEGSCDLTGSELKSLENVKHIGGDLTIPLYTKAEDLSAIEYIGGNIKCDAENTSDVVNLMKKIKLNPKTFLGYINPSISEYLSRPYFAYKENQSMESALKALQAKALYEQNN